MEAPGLSSLELTTVAGQAPASARIQNLRALGAILLVVLGFVLFWPTTLSLVEQWEDTVRRTYTHGYLIVALTLWLLWRNRALWARVELRPSVLAFVAVVAAGIVWLIAYRAGVRIAHQALLPAMIFGAFVACYGWAAGRRNLLPFGYLYFAVPLWDALNPLLQSTSTFAVRMLLRTAGIPAYFSGNTFTLPAGSLEIAGGCSGLHFFVVGIAIAVLYGEVNRDSLRTRVKLVVLAAVLAMLTNWIRIFIIAVAAHVTDMQHYLVREEHYSFGWVMFAGTMVIYFLIVRRWPVQPEPATDADATSPQTGAIVWHGAALALASLLIAPAWLLADDNEVAPQDLPQVVPMRVANWSTESPARDDWQPVFVGADLIQRAAFSQDTRTVEGFAALYADQHQGKELVGFNNSVLGESMTVRRRASSASVRPWMEMEAADWRGKRWLVWYAYRLDRQWYDRTLPLQIQYGVRSLVSAPLSAVAAFRTPCAGDDCSAARAALREFTTSMTSGT
ncbi:MAG: exosortase A [Steroidobacter sp.]